MQLKSYLKKHKILIAMLLIIIFTYPAITLSRIVYKVVLDHFYKTKNFYFSSDLLTENNSIYKVSNWSGVDKYIITINMNSIFNEKKRATSNIDYKITYSCEDKVNCYLSKEESIIPVSNEVDSNRDSFNLTVIPTKIFNNNEETKIEIKATSTNPYKKSISATFILKASKVGLSYEITDKKNDIFAVLRLTNSLTYYTVKENFGSYKVGDELDQDVYNSLSKEEKSKCYSLMVDISFDPKILNMDLTSTFYLKSVKDNNNVRTVKLRRVLVDFDKYKVDDLIDEDTYKTINNANYDKLSDEYEYVSGIIINIGAISSGDIKFYKKNKFKDYTYPFINDESIIKVS